jgi:hypothetical protein
MPISNELTPIPIEQLVQEVYASSESEAQGHILAKLVGKVYETAPMPMRTRLLEQLLRPVGVLSLVAIANGVFAKIRFHTGWPDVPLSAVEVQNVGTDDVVALAYRLLQIGGDALNGVTQLLNDSPSLAGSAAAVLVVLLLRRARNRRADDDAAQFK